MWTFIHTEVLRRRLGYGAPGPLVKEKDTEWSLYLSVLFPTEFSESEPLLSGAFWPTIPFPGFMDGTAFAA